MRCLRRFALVAGAVCLGLMALSWLATFVGVVARNDGHAMAPTIEAGDLVVVNKLAYRLGSPRRDDVVVHLYPVNPSKRFVKRVIGEQGDTVRIAKGTVFVNDAPRDDSRLPPEYRSHEDWGPQVVPEGYCFVMGDHRNDSSDSRHWGFVPVKYVIGRVAFRLTGPKRFSAVR